MIPLVLLAILAGAVMTALILQPSLIANFDVSDIVSAAVIAILLSVIAFSNKNKKNKSRDRKTPSRMHGDGTSISQIFANSRSTNNSLETSMQHDIRTPLTTLQGAVELLKSSKLDESQLGYVLAIQNATGELRMLMSKLMSLHLGGDGIEAINEGFDDKEKVIMELLAIENKTISLAKIDIILAEDDNFNRTIMEKLLGKIGCEKLRTASDGNEVVRLFSEAPCDLILMDCNMPGLNGYEATKKIRSMDKGKNIKIFALTANVSPEERNKAVAAGMDDFFTKPITKATLHHIISSAVLGINRPI